MGRPVIRLEGQRFGKLLVLSQDLAAPSGSSKHAKWLCRCDCGTLSSMLSSNLRRGTQSCGCVWAEELSTRNFKHGMFGTKAYENHISALKRTRKLQATPRWANLDKIREIYARCPLGYHVDHVVPLKSEKVCGLHVEFNLRYLKAESNLKKKNSFDDRLLPECQMFPGDNTNVIPSRISNGELEVVHG